MGRLLTISSVLVAVAGCAASGAGDAGSDAATLPDVFYPFDAGDCTDGGVDVPAALRSCTSDGECALATAWLDGCGSLVAHGIRRDALPSFERAASTCRRSLAPCDGLSLAITADDGNTAPMGGVEVRCEGGTCTTRVASGVRCGLWTCTSTQICVETCFGGDVGIVSTHQCVELPAGCAGPSDCACIAAANSCIYCAAPTFACDLCPLGTY